MQVPQIKASKLFDINTVTRAQIVDLLRHWGYDNGSHVHGLLLQIAELKGFTPITIVDVYPDRTHCWEIKALNSYSEKEAYIKNDSIANFERREFIGAHNNNRGLAYYVMTWVGKRPEHDDIVKKMKQHGVRFS